MAAQELVVSDLQSDNFDLLRFPSLTGFPSLIESDDLNMMARMGSLFDAKQPATASSPQSANNAGLQHQQQHQMQQHMRHIPPPMQQLLSRPQQAMPFSPNSPGYPMLSPHSAAPEATPAYLPPQPAVMMTTPFALPAQTSFESERSHHNFPGPSAEDAAESDYSDEESDPEQDTTPRRSSRKRNATQVSREGDDQDWSKPKKKVGRPITYNGDPNAPELTEAERRKVKRRIANRESARRVQQRRKEMIDELQHKMPLHPYGIFTDHHKSAEKGTEETLKEEWSGNSGMPSYMSETVATRRDKGDNTLCAECGSPHNLKLCSGCKKICFCGKECHKSAWKAWHKKQCLKIQADKTEDAAPQP